MSNEFISKEIEKIINDTNFPFPLNTAMAAAWILGNYKGINLKVLDMKPVSSLSDYFIFASATNSSQMKAMANEVIVQLKKYDLNPLSHEGKHEADWVLLDLGDIIVHIFLESARENYDLDGLYKEARPVEIPQSYYFSSDVREEQAVASENKSYFNS